MYFEDEKDILDDGSSLHIAEDGTVSWDDILSEQNDGGVSDDALQSNDLVYESASADNAGGVESIRNENPSEIEYDSDPLNGSDISVSNDSNQSSGEEYSSDDNISDDFDIDKQLEQLSTGDDIEASDGFTMPSKEKKKSNSTALLLALLVAVLVMGGIYYYFTNFQNGGGDLVKPSTKTEMDNMTQDKLDERKAEAVDEDEAAPEEKNEPQQQDLSDDSQIPVVNDDNVKELKPEPKEKKQVITIIPTGRPNPFMPLQKYSTIDVKETIVEYDKVGIPTPPVSIPKRNENISKMLTISVSGIMFDNVNPSAIITLDGNDYFVKKGDKLDDYKVVEIGKNYVTVAFGANLYKANIGEEFKISSKIYGSAQFMGEIPGGGRQYYSVSNKKDDNPKTETKKADGANYFSEDDVEIKTKQE